MMRRGSGRRLAIFRGGDWAVLGGGKGYEVSRARELLATLGVERYHLRVKDLAEYLNKHPVTVTGWVMRGVRRRAEDPGTVARIEALDRSLCDRPGGKD